ncbi:MAG TPA: T9SS type A sorting domain-containing protein [Ignavibacteria bacterium]|nr:T9SS type A sorting domain-containing protein [Ignavibacteria bacterium]HMR40347.1 T9SS type A sorting domain-containing protein [Ignavibacteria bacterium]
MKNIYSFKKCFTALVFSVFFASFFITEISRAEMVGSSSFQPVINRYVDDTWAIVSSSTVTLQGFTVRGVNAVTWNSDDLLFYAIVKVDPNPSRRLVRINPATGVCTDIGPLAGNFSSLTYNSTSGILYAIGGAGSGVYAERIYSLNINTAAETFLGGPYSVGSDGEVIAFNYDDGYIYHWSGNVTANMEKINASTFAATPVSQSGVSHSEIWGAVYIGGNTFIVTDINLNAYTITPTGVVALQQSGINSDAVRGLGYVDALLPVELSSFTSTVTGRNAELNWSTVSEANNSGFEIERSAAENENSNNWTKAGFVNGNGNSAALNNYSFTDRGLNSGKYSYRLKQIDFNGNFEYHNLNEEILIGIPADFSVSQNYPNPFNPSTRINFDIPVDGNVNITLFDISGKEVSTIVNEVKTAGYYTVSFDASSLPSGSYFYRINSTGSGISYTATKKMLLLK